MLKVKNVSAGYDGIDVLHEVSLNVNEGEIVSLVGLNGAGKSTLLKTISGILPAKKGDIYFDDQKVTNHSTDSLVKKGMVHVPESRFLFPALSVKENLLLGTAAKDNKFRKLKSDELFNFVFDLFPVLKERSSQRAGTLSGGEQQMLAIGRGLMSNPKLLLLDEPSLGIAPILVEKIFESLLMLNKEGITIFLVEQNVSISLDISHHAYVLDLGKVIMSGTGKEVLNNPQTQEVYLGGF
ncbi:branched-chain amino acid transport system ATP-binding protein [Salirhabdus euzebyi]|uniref:Branched-chain amino acid transport system ATP-binding protein n=1 Tax=Salirhabdus euzebyi TaxID=394506 RepID=A0A841Q5G3_9BACI|nr:ABC transporter ATP-binding protein [Salirhabdus euzebyi]MBB6453709.1 branched-chain amino acid transport system ATP-binding protein [Salirhabdus euzebyi]